VAYRSGFLLFLALGAFACTDEASEQATRETAFEESMRNVVLEGSFTVTGRDDDARRTERYEIEKAVHLAGDVWTFHARIQYGEHDVTAPIPVRLVWADDTPMVTLTDISIPGLGDDFTARVVFFRDHYSGMWWHGETGGNMFGVIRR